MWKMTVSIWCLFLTATALGQQPEPFTCTCRVVDSNNRPVERAEVICYEVFYDYERGQRRWEIVGRAKTGEEGRFNREVMVTERSSVWVAARKHGLSLGWGAAAYDSAKLDFITQLNEPAVLAGVVVDENDTGISGAKVRVCLKNEQANLGVSFSVPEDWFTTKTDAQGKFSFDNIPSDATADFWVETAGKVSCWTFWKTGGDAGYQFEVGRNDIQIVLGPEAKILGQVVDENRGNPVEGIRLLARPDKGWANYYCSDTVVSDSNGQFCLKGMPAGTYSLQVVPPQEKMADWVGKDVKVTLESGQTVRDVKVSVNKGAILEVTARDAETNELIEGVSVTVSQEANYGRHPCYYKSVVTDDKGTVRFRTPVGECRVRAGSKEYAYYRGMEPIAVAKGKVTRQEIQLSRKPHISGIVRDQNGQPAAGVVVASKPVCNQTVSTDNDGRFEVSWRDRSNIRKKFLLAQDVQHNLAGLVEFKDESKSVDIKLEPAFTLEGQVADPSGNPIDNAAVKLRASLPGWITHVGEHALTDANGFYQICAVPPPQPDFTYSVEIESKDHGPERSGKISFDNDPAKPVELDTIVLKPSDQSISGVVVDSEDKPAAGIRIFISGPRGSSTAGQPERRAVTDEQGRFFIKRVCKGPLRIQAGYSSDPKGTGSLDAHGGDKDVKVILGQRGAHVPYVSLDGKQLPELKDFGIKLSPADMDGKRILVCFWDMQQRPSRHCINQLARQAEQLKKQDIISITVQASEIDQEALNQWINKYNIPFPVGMVQGDVEKIRFAWGVKSLPWLILTGSEHIVRTEGFSIDELDERITSLREK